MKDWLTIPETCDLLHISRSTFYRFIKRGHLHPKLSLAPYGVMIPRAEVEAILAKSIVQN